jgi:hypothetical protein
MLRAPLGPADHTARPVPRSPRSMPCGRDFDLVDAGDLVEAGNRCICVVNIRPRA